MFELLESARDELLKKRCSIPDNHCKRFLDSDLEELLCLVGTVRSKEISIAKMVLAAVINMTNRYIMVEERYSDKEYERVEGLFQCRQNHIASSLAKTWSSYKTNKRVNNTKLQD